MIKYTNRTLYGILEQNQKRTYIACAIISLVSLAIVFFSAYGVA